MDTIIVAVGDYHPPILWYAALIVRLTPSQWQKVVANAKKDGKLEEFKQWLNGKVVVFTRRGVAPATSRVTVEEVS